MGFELVSCEDQYKKFPQLKRSEVLELLKWKETQPHLPESITGKFDLFFCCLFYDIPLSKVYN